MITSRFRKATVIQRIQKKAKAANISVSISHLFLNDTPLGIVTMMNDIFEIATNYTSVLVVMNCSEQDASLLVTATKTVSSRPVHFQWLLLREDGHVTEKVEYLPTDILSIRSTFDERNWIRDALFLLNRSLHAKDHNEIGNVGSFSSNVNNKLKLYR